MLGNDQLKDKRPADDEMEDCSLMATFKSDGPYWGTETRGIIMFDSPEKDAFIRFLCDEYTKEEWEYLEEQERIKKSLRKPQKEQVPPSSLDFTLKLADLTIVGSVNISARLDKVLNSKLEKLIEKYGSIEESK